MSILWVPRRTCWTAGGTGTGRDREAEGGCVRRSKEKAHRVSECITPEENQISSFGRYRLAEPCVTDIQAWTMGSRDHWSVIRKNSLDET